MVSMNFFVGLKTDKFYDQALLFRKSVEYNHECSGLYRVVLDELMIKNLCKIDNIVRIEIGTIINL